MRRSVFAFTAIAAAIACCGPAQAQQRELSADEAKQFFAQVQQDATKFVQSGDVAAIRQWTASHLASDAHFRVLVETLHDNQPKVWSAADLDKADIEGVQGVMGGAMLRSIQDYELHINVTKVVPHGADAATVEATWTDTATVVPQAARAAAQQQDTVGQASQSGAQPGGAQPTTLQVKRTAQCDHLLVREQGALKLGLSTCRGQVQF
jgi:hypothetical protein